MSIDLLRHYGEQIRDAEGEADRVYEVVIGIVVDNKDPEGLGRVKLRIPTLPGEDASTWAKIASLGAGKDRGWWFLPELNDEVLVSFEHGDIGRPVVLGALWNGVDEPPGKGNGKDILHSRSGSKLVLDDEDGKVTFEDGGGKGKVTIAKGGDITIEALKGDVELQATKGQLSIVADKIKMKAEKKLLIHANGPVTIGSGGEASVRASSFSANGPKLHLNPPGGVKEPKEAEAKPAKVPDPYDGEDGKGGKGDGKGGKGGKGGGTGGDASGGILV